MIQRWRSVPLLQSTKTRERTKTGGRKGLRRFSNKRKRECREKKHKAKAVFFSSCFWYFFGLSLFLESTTGWTICQLSRDVDVSLPSVRHSTGYTVEQSRQAKVGNTRVIVGLIIRRLPQILIVGKTETWGQRRSEVVRKFTCGRGRWRSWKEKDKRYITRKEIYREESEDVLPQCSKTRNEKERYWVVKEVYKTVIGRENRFDEEADRNYIGRQI